MKTIFLPKLEYFLVCVRGETFLPLPHCHTVTIFAEQMPRSLKRDTLRIGMGH